MCINFLTSINRWKLVLNLLQLGVGMAGVDFLAAVASFPNPDDKIRSTNFEVIRF